MGQITGLNTAVEIGLETTWGTAVTPTIKLKHNSESLKWTPEYKAEETLIGNVTDEDSALVGCAVEGDLSLLARPDVIGFLAAVALGEDVSALVDGTTGVYKHTITCMQPGVSNSLPSLTVIVGRHVAVKAYTGMKASSFKLESAPKDFVKLTLGLKGKNEAVGTLEGLTPSSLKAFKFADGSVTIDTVGQGSVTGFSVSVDNSLDEGEPTLSSGIYNSEFEPQKRKISVSLDCIYDSSLESLRESKFKGGAYANVELTLTSPEEVETGESYKVVIKLPRVRITEAHPNAADSGKIKVSLAGDAYETTGTEPITIEVYNGDIAAYV